MPDIIPIQEDSATMLGWIIGVALMLLMYKVMSDQKKKEEFKDNMESM